MEEINMPTIKEITEKVEETSTGFEKTNTELKRKYLIWNIHFFNTIASKVSVSKGPFGTGYPFYVLDKNLQGQLPIIPEQIRYNRQLVKDGEPFQKSIWNCKSCLERNYADMPDLKRVCKPCPNMINELKPRKLINRLPDMDMWLVCEDGSIQQAQEELTKLLAEIKMKTSDINPLLSLDEMSQITTMLKEGKRPKIFLPIDAHIMEYSKMKQLIEAVPRELEIAKQKGKIPFLPIQPKSYRKEWQYDDEAYNFVYDYLSSFTAVNFEEELQQCLDVSRLKVMSENTPQELFGVLLKSATPANFRRLQTVELEECFYSRVEEWSNSLGTGKLRNCKNEEEQRE